MGNTIYSTEDTKKTGGFRVYDEKTTLLHSSKLVASAVMHLQLLTIRCQHTYSQHSSQRYPWHSSVQE